MDERYETEYLGLIDRLNDAEDARHDFIAGEFKATARPVAVDGPIWSEWDVHDENVEEARQALRTWLQSVKDLWRP